MVYSRGPARFTALIENRTNTCGGPKKSGLSRQIGNLAINNPVLRFGVNTTYGQKCLGNFQNTSQTAIRNARRGISGI